MLKIENLKLAPGESPELLASQAARFLKIHEKDLLSLRIVRRSVDARREIRLVYTVEVEVRQETAILHRIHSSQLSRTIPAPAYAVPAAFSCSAPSPVVVGAGPAGLFCTLVLAKAGLHPILLERGKPVEARQADVETFWRTGVLNTHSNVQFGEGGAGAFSDGKLNTGTRDFRHRFIMEELVSCGAPEDILIDAKPHIGTDNLHTALINLRKQLQALGAEIRYESQLTDLKIDGTRISEITVANTDKSYQLPCCQLVLCLGHSARDTFELLHMRGIPMEAKPFAVGVRIEHRQADIDAAQYRQYAGHPGLPVSTYKLACHLPNGRAAYSFCVCPGGEVVAAASEENRVVTNGMSEFARARENINGALLVNVTPNDFSDTGPLAGIAFQRQLEEDTYQLGGGGYTAPAQLVGDFLAGRPSQRSGRVNPSYRPAVRFTDLRRCLPPFVADTIAGALPLLGKKLRGYDAPDAVLTAVESRSSSPVRILRDATYQSSVRGIYPCGEGAGYAGGILSAAADGMRAAEHLIDEIKTGGTNHGS